MTIIILIIITITILGLKIQKSKEVLPTSENNSYLGKALYLGLPSSEERSSGLRVLDLFPPCPRRTKHYLEPEHALVHINTFLIPAHYRKVKKSLNILLHFSSFPPKNS
jgi:hypothetical protein